MRIVLVMLLCLLALPATAQEKAAEKAAAQRVPERIVKPMRAVDSVTLRAEGVLIRLWGIKPAMASETALELQALDMMDKLIQEQQVNCKIAGGAMPEYFGRCATQENRDLALELLGAGLAVVDRRQTYDSVFAASYEKAQEAARLSARGVWAMAVEKRGNDSAVPAWLEPHLGFLVPLALVAGPFLGLLIVALVMAHWLKNMSETQRREAEAAHRKEETLQSREKQVLVSTLEGELAENKNKIEAFLVIYGDLLRSLKDPAEMPKYQQVGDIVQKHPNFSKAVFETNISKLSLLDIKVAGDLSRLYSSLPTETEYINLDPQVPLDTAVKLVEKVLKEAEDLIAPINAVMAALQAQQK